MVDSACMSAVVAVFARPPLAGQVKTRLAATLGDAMALDVYRRLLAMTLKSATDSGYPCVLFAAAPSAELSAMAASYGVSVRVQQGSGLGERMVRAIADLHRQYQRVLLIGSDCPALAPQHLQQGFAALQDAAVVLGPAEDGGYWLIGSAEPECWHDYHLLDPVRFGGHEALAMTLCCLKACTQSRLQYHGASIAMLAALWDLDTEADYHRAVSAGLLS
ncbi:TIGR04282 family arsenosugar biosynthesis glycosyltransferase [Alcanivorax sp. 1008]|uniref:TIGR04282 family arsenosugar biosynthesis glycosyltransferase n=1 Tax=Alcanivorax sp. 1008 TaxID=2816853 RepID=UPI001DB96FA0|nr:TIGR04282 family arsenosugar biosynthesis glycosyltransferase [Alcanivorax sp. 1008]MCC1495671.1 TIGR04282 family arsenosugar biosynthesis glycosyltransferase [Alcanivorax sp. 1008]